MTRLIRFYGRMSVEGVVSPEYEDQAVMIVSARSSRLMLKERRAFSSSFYKLWTWLNERHAKRASKLVAVQYSNLMSMKMGSSKC